MEKLFNEIWKPVKGFEGLYEVSNKGNVRSVDRYVMNGNRCCLLKGKPRKGQFQGNNGIKKKKPQFNLLWLSSLKSAFAYFGFYLVLCIGNVFFCDINLNCS